MLLLPPLPLPPQLPPLLLPLLHCRCAATALGWESRRHVGDMSARQPKVGTFGRLGLVVPTQIRSRHFFCVGDCRLSPNFL
jgi:hypothetical protein